MKTEIVHLCYQPFYLAGSVNRLVEWQIRNITELNHLCISYDQHREQTYRDSQFYIIPGKANTGRRLFYRALPRQWRARRYCGVLSPDHILWISEILRLLRRCRAPVVISHDHYKLGRLLRRSIDWPCRLVFAQHGYSYFVGELSQLYSLNSFDSHVLLTRSSYEFDRHRVHAYEPSVEVIPNPIDLAQFRLSDNTMRTSARREFGLPDSCSIVVSVGRQVPKKGAHILIEAWRTVLDARRDALLWIVGSMTNEHGKYLRSLAKGAGVEQAVRFEGQVPPDQIARVLAAADIFAFPSLCHEGMPLSLAQAVACGVPCLASDAPATREAFEGSGVEFVDFPNRPSSWACKLLEQFDLLERGRGDGGAMRRWAEQHFSESMILDRWREFYKRQIRLAGGVV